MHSFIKKSTHHIAPLLGAIWRVDFFMNECIALHCYVGCDLFKNLYYLKIKPTSWKIEWLSKVNDEEIHLFLKVNETQDTMKTNHKNGHQTIYNMKITIGKTDF